MLTAWSNQTCPVSYAAAPGSAEKIHTTPFNAKAISTMNADAAPGVMTHISPAAQAAAAMDSSEISQTPASSNMPEVKTPETETNAENTGFDSLVKPLRAPSLTVMGYIACGAATALAAYKVVSLVNNALAWAPAGTREEGLEAIAYVRNRMRADPTKN